MKTALIQPEFKAPELCESLEGKAASLRMNYFHVLRQVDNPGPRKCHTA